MALSWTDRGTGSDGNSVTTLACSPTSTIAAGSGGIFWLAYDNAGASGTDSIVSTDHLTDTVGNTWVFITSRTRTQASGANDGVSVAVYECLQLNNALTSAGSVTVTWSPATVAKVYAFGQISAAAGNTINPVTATSAAGSSTTPTVTTASITSGDIVVGMFGVEQTAAITADSDSTNGTWTTAQTQTVGSGTTGMELCMQAKVTTGTGTQTYNLTVTSTDWVGEIRSYTEVAQADATLVIPNRSLTLPVYRM